MTSGPGTCDAASSSRRHFMRLASSPLLQSDAKVFMAVRIGRYPVHRQMLPSSAASISALVAPFGWLTRNSVMFMTKPTLH
jgi:hypothetical protein